MGIQFVASIVNCIKNIAKITCTSPYFWECDCKIKINSDPNFLRPHKNMRLTCGGHFKVFVESLENHLHIAMLLGMQVQMFYNFRLY